MKQRIEGGIKTDGGREEGAKESVEKVTTLTETSGVDPYFLGGREALQFCASKSIEVLMY